MTTVSFSGHRPKTLGGFGEINPLRDKICIELERVLHELKPEKAISGMALGTDMWAAKICIKLGIPFIAAVPFVGQQDIWPIESKKEYLDVLDHAEKIVIVSRGGYSAWKLQKRNEWMVDNSDIVIAVFNGTSGGTKNCIEYAKKNNKRIIIIDPGKLNENL